MKIKNIKKIDKEKTYDLHIEDNYNYYVGEKGILVHNSGKDFSKVDRSGAYYLRYLCKNMVAANICDKITMQISYAIGMNEPLSLFVDTHGTCKIPFTTDEEISNRLLKSFDFSPYNIKKTLQLNNPIYLKTASYGHFGKKSYTEDGIKYYTWEDLDLVKQMNEIFF